MELIFIWIMLISYENIAGNGGAIYNTNKGTIVITNSKLHHNNNTARSDGIKEDQLFTILLHQK